MHQKLACVQAITFWIGLAFGISLTAALIVLPQTKPPIFHLLLYPVQCYCHLLLE